MKQKVGKGEIQEGTRRNACPTKGERENKTKKRKKKQC